MDDFSIRNITGSPALTRGKGPSESGNGFGTAIKGAISKVNRLEEDANDTIAGLLQGKTDVHQTMIAMQKADMSMRLLLTVRNKVLDAYREIMRMQF